MAVSYRAGSPSQPNFERSTFQGAAHGGGQKCKENSMGCLVLVLRLPHEWGQTLYRALKTDVLQAQGITETKALKNPGNIKNLGTNEAIQSWRPERPVLIIQPFLHLGPFS